MKKSTILKSFLYGIAILLSNITYSDDQNLDNSSKEFDPYPEEISQPEMSLPGQMPAIDILRFITPENLEDGCDGGGGCFINLPKILQENIYLKTVGPVTRRSLLDEPALRYYCLEGCNWNFTFDVFYNYTPRVFFTKDSPFIQSYIDLSNQNIINELDRGLEIVSDVKVDIPGILGLFKNFKLQQHKAGAFFGFCKSFDCGINLTLRMPLYYLVDHYFLTQEEQDTIQNSPLLASLPTSSAGATSKDETEKFGLCHLAADRLGIGDLRINLLSNIYSTNCVDLYFGLLATAPTARAIKKGILTGTYDPCAAPPDFNIRQIFDLAFPMSTEPIPNPTQKIKDITSNLLIGTLDRLTTILFDAPLGNGGHFGGGPQFDLNIALTDCWAMHTYAMMEGFSKKRENRFFLTKKDPQEFDRDYRNEDSADDNLAFLNEQIINTFFPERLYIPVRPGIITNIAQSFIYRSPRWYGSIGFDYWNQRNEKLYVNERAIDNYEINKGTRPAAEQGKIFLGIGYAGKPFYECIYWNITLNGDGTVFNKGIGENYNLDLRLNVDF